MLENQDTVGRSARIRRAIVALLLATALVGALATPSFANSPIVGSRSDLDSSDISPSVDALFLRPLGLVTLLTGIALCLPATLITAVTRPTEIAKPFRELVVNPARYVWVDRLGEH